MAKGDYVFRFGDIGDKFYVILKGEVSVRIPDPKLKYKPLPSVSTPMSSKHNNNNNAATDKRSMPAPQLLNNLSRKGTMKERAKSIQLHNSNDTFLTSKQEEEDEKLKEKA